MKAKHKLSFFILKDGPHGQLLLLTMKEYLLQFRLSW